MFVILPPPPNSYVEALTPMGWCLEVELWDIIGFGWGHDGDGIGAHIRGWREQSSHLALEGHCKKVAVYSQEQSSSCHVDTPISDF